MRRIALTPGTLRGLVTARKRHRCNAHFRDHHYIEAGSLYLATALPPNHPDIGNVGWWHSRYCLDCCPAEYDPRQKGE